MIFLVLHFLLSRHSRMKIYFLVFTDFEHYFYKIYVKLESFAREFNID